MSRTSDEFADGPASWSTARVVPLGGGRHALTIHAGATSHDVAAAVARLPVSVFLDHRSVRPDGSAVTLVFRELADGTPDRLASPVPAAPGPDLAEAVELPTPVGGAARGHASKVGATIGGAEVWRSLELAGIRVAVEPALAAARTGLPGARRRALCPRGAVSRGRSERSISA
jgi:uncharacterized repeat protein (TIGR03917 family)